MFIANRFAPAYANGVELTDNAHTKRPAVRGLRRGSQLTDTLLAAGLGIILLIAVIGTYNKVSARIKASAFNKELVMIADAVHSTDGQNMADYSQVNASDLAKSTYMDQRYTSAGSLISPYGGTITVTGTGAGGGTHGLTTFTITANGITKAGCIAAATADYGDQLVSRVPTGGSNSNDEGEAAPLSLHAAQAACTSNMTMTFEFQ